MTLANHLAKNLKSLFLGKHWIGADLKTQIEDIDWELATSKIHDLNSIAALVFHLNYYLEAVLKVLNGGPLEASDKFSYDMPPITSKADWDQLVERIFNTAEAFSDRVDQLTEEEIWGDFDSGKYGTTYANIVGIVDHSHYHLGQIVLIKKMLLQQKG